MVAPHLSDIARSVDFSPLSQVLGTGSSPGSGKPSRLTRY